jgi:hypothetical protein
MINHGQLLTEILADSTAKGYAAHVTSGNDEAIASLLNAPGGGQTILQRVEAWKVAGAIEPDEFDGISAALKNRLTLYMGTGWVDFRNANVRKAFQSAFAAGSASRVALVALSTRAASRAEVLFGEGAVVHHLDVAKALRAS